MSPDEHTIQETFLEVGNGHTLYVHDWGNKQAETVVLFLHGGPGSQSKDSHKQNFDPATQRIIFHDQRGAGKSLPYGSLEHNTTHDLVEDILKIADHLRLEKFIVMGSSWGSALSLFFALAHPERVSALLLSGVWTCSKEENSWVDKGGFRTFFPELWERYAASVPEKFRNDPSAWHFPRILGSDPEAAKKSAYEYDCLEGGALSLDDRFTPDDFETFDPSGTRIEVQYLANNCFMPDHFIFKHAAELTMPVWLVQGRYDMVCPPKTAYELNRLIPDSYLIWTTSGHRTERETWNVMRTILLQLTGRAG